MEQYVHDEQLKEFTTEVDQLQVRCKLYVLIHLAWE